MRNSLGFRAFCLLVALAATTLACGAQDKKNEKKDDAAAEEDSADATVAKNFSFNEKTENDLDKAVLESDETKPGWHVVTLYFKGGAEKSCASWKATVKGKDVAPSDKDELKEDGDDKWKASFKTYGGKDGIRLVAKAGTKISLKGTQTFCKKAKDETEFDVKIEVKKTKLKKIVEGTDSANQAVVKVRISDAKKGEEKKDKEDDEAGDDDKKKVEDDKKDGEKTDGDEAGAGKDDDDKKDDAKDEDKKDEQ